jgi:hypothetical protein
MLLVIVDVIVIIIVIVIFQICVMYDLHHISTIYRYFSLICTGSDEPITEKSLKRIRNLIPYCIYITLQE